MSEVLRGVRQGEVLDSQETCGVVGRCLQSGNVRGVVGRCLPSKWSLYGAIENSWMKLKASKAMGQQSRDMITMGVKSRDMITMGVESRAMITMGVENCKSGSNNSNDGFGVEFSRSME